MKAEIKNEETKNDKVISSLVHLFTNLYVWNVQNATCMIAGIGIAGSLCGFIATVVKLWAKGQPSDAEYRWRQPVILPQVNDNVFALKHDLSFIEDAFVPWTHRDHKVPAL